MIRKSALTIVLSLFTLLGFSSYASAETQTSSATTPTVTEQSVTTEQPTIESVTSNNIQTLAASAPSTWYYTTYRSYVGYPPATIYVSVENTAVKRRYHGYLTLISTGYAPGNWRTYAGTLYLEGGPYPIPAALNPSEELLLQQNQ